MKKTEGQHRKRTVSPKRGIDEMLKYRDVFQDENAVRIDENGRLIIPKNERIQRQLRKIVEPLDSGDDK